VVWKQQSQVNTASANCTTRSKPPWRERVGSGAALHLIGGSTIGQPCGSSPCRRNSLALRLSVIPWQDNPTSANLLSEHCPACSAEGTWFHLGSSTAR